MAGRGQRGRGTRGAGGGRGRGRKDDAKKDPLQNVAKFRFLAKAVMAPYPSEDGCPFYLKDADDEKSFFKKGFIASNVVAPDNCEALWRLGMAVALYASAFHVGGGAVLENVGEDCTIGDKTGLKQLAVILRGEDGQAFLRAAEVLNVGPGGRVGRREAKTAVEAYVAFLKNQEAPLRKAVSRAASFSAKIYQASMAIAEHADLIANPKEWAKAMQGEKNQPGVVQKWIKDPKDSEKLVAAITDGFMKKMEAAKKPAGKKKAAADSSDDDDAASASSSDESESGSGRSSKKSAASDDEDSDEAEATKGETPKGKSIPASADKADSAKEAPKTNRRSGTAIGAKTKRADKAPVEPTVRPAVSVGKGARAADSTKEGKAKRRSCSEKKSERKRTRDGDGDDAPGDGPEEKKRRPTSTPRKSEAGATNPLTKPAVLPMEEPEITVNAAEMEAALDQWRGDALADTSASTETALQRTASLEEVHDLLAEVPPSLMQAVGLGAWRRCVLDVPTDPGPDRCAGYLRVIRDVLREAICSRNAAEAPAAEEGELDPEEPGLVVDLDAESPPRDSAGSDGADRGSEADRQRPAATAVRSDKAAAKPRPPPGPPPPEAFELPVSTPPRRRTPRGRDAE